MPKSEISWKRPIEGGAKMEVNARRVGGRWIFYIRERRYDQWQVMKNPLLDDWLELLDGVQRRIARRLLRPEEELRLKSSILELFPDARFE
jgi:hypothetical protein